LEFSSLVFTLQLPPWKLKVYGIEWARIMVRKRMTLRCRCKGKMLFEKGDAKVMLLLTAKVVTVSAVGLSWSAS
jgi:hypothetical protein